MANSYKTPGVFIKEISIFPPSVAAVETAIPAFIGYTEKVKIDDIEMPAGDVLTNAKPTRIKSLLEYEEIYGGPFLESFTIEIQNKNEGLTDTNGDPLPADWDITSTGGPTEPTLYYRMYYSLQLYFANGGGPCYIKSVGLYDTTPGENSINHAHLTQEGLGMIEKEDEPTILVFPDAIKIKEVDNFYGVFIAAIDQCARLQDRFTLVDIFNQDVDIFRDKIGTSDLRYAAAYHPWLETTIDYVYDPPKVAITIDGTSELFTHTGSSPAPQNPPTPALRRDNPNPPGVINLEDYSLFHRDNALYHKIVGEINRFNVVMPPSCFMAGVYAKVDSTRGVWKAPANVSLTGVIRPTITIDDLDQQLLNVHPTGKSVNAIRSFVGKGILVWGARTLDGNSNEWRYVPVRRFFNFVEESVKKATERFVFEPNDANTWTKVRGMIENFLLIQWRAGALAGAKPDDAFFVKVGLPDTMTSLDILEGRMNVEIGMAVVRPAEFIILKFSHKMQVS